LNASRFDEIVNAASSESLEGLTSRLDTIPGEENAMTNLAGVVQQLRKERDQAGRTVERLDAALAALNGGSYGKRNGTRSRLSAAARARIAAAQRARWAKARAKNESQKQNVVSMPKKKTMSVAARRKISAAQRARWARVKASQKKTA
jgi:hypothetical protein